MIAMTVEEIPARDAAYRRRASRVILSFMRISVAAVFCIVGWLAVAHAQYVLELKNGRQITVPSYREEGPMIKFQGFGGEIGISRDQIKAVRKIETGRATGFDISTPGSQASASRRPPEKSESATVDKPLTEDQQRAREEMEYRERLGEITRELKEARAQYQIAVRGTTDPDATQLVTEEQIRARSADVTSRFKDAQRNPSEPAPVKVLRPSPFSSLPPTVEYDVGGQTAPNLGRPEPYTELEQLLSNLRKRILQLEGERERLIKEMQDKNFDTTGLLLD
jgi:hypothetical protein